MADTSGLQSSERPVYERDIRVCTRSFGRRAAMWHSVVNACRPTMLDRLAACGWDPGLCVAAEREA